MYSQRKSSIFCLASSSDKNPFIERQYLETLHIKPTLVITRGSFCSFFVFRKRVHAVREEPFATRFINLDKLYRHYSLIADKMDGEETTKPMRDVSELGMGLLVKMGVVG